MGPPRQHQALGHSRACLNCQKRKSRCQPGSGGGPCSYCTRTGKECSFGSTPDRTRLTRKNLDAAELRCSRLHALLKSLHPELDVEAALANPAFGDELVVPGESDDERFQSSSDREEPTHEFEWHEASLPPHSESQDAEAGVTDGMATFSSLGAGYLGSSSGSNLLQEIASMLPELAASGSPSNSRSSGSRTRRHGEHHDPPDLAASAMTGYLVDAYFLFYNVSYPILQERAFRQKASSRGLKRGKSSWNVIYLLVLAIGHWLSTSDAHHARSSYYSAARASLSIHMLESGTLETIQALLLMGNYLQKMDRPNTGYNFIGVAYKMALGMGLHREPPDYRDSVGHERLRQLFWVIYCFDSGFNITTGRPPNATEGIIDTRVPRNMQDEGLEATAPVPAEVGYPTGPSAIIAQARLAKHANSIYHEYLLAKTADTKVEYQVAEAMERTLVDWRQSLPSYFTSQDVPMWFIGPRAVVMWKEQNLRIILWRGSTRNHSFLPSKADAETRCLDIAMRSIHDIAAFCGAYQGILHLGIVWYATYFLFQAALVLEASYLDRETQRQLGDESATWRVVVSRARDCLALLAPKSKSAKRCLEVLDLIHKRADRMTDLRSGLDGPQPLGTPGLASAPDSLPPAEPLLGQGTDNLFTVPVEASGLNDDGSDPTMRMILDNTPWGYLDNTPMDALFSDWIYPSTF